ncbi:MULTISPECIES: hypothetical protein [Rhodomicrobium]|uniref:hypothetical protein n=1 Tax=Rhodomicrobium TaxID=1068 RepID=UPI000F73EF71|nr:MULTISPECIES: hypothetical protein [Rhodomicrobium]
MARSHEVRIIGGTGERRGRIRIRRNTLAVFLPAGPFGIKPPKIPENPLLVLRDARLPRPPMIVRAED